MMKYHKICCTLSEYFRFTLLYVCIQRMFLFFLHIFYIFKISSNIQGVPNLNINSSGTYGGSINYEKKSFKDLLIFISFWKKISISTENVTE